MLKTIYIYRLSISYCLCIISYILFNSDYIKKHITNNSNK